MNYHLHREGQDLGLFSSEELRRRRQSGELSGTEYVWAEGMTEWKPLDSVLWPETSGGAPLAGSTRKRPVAVWLSIIAVLFVAALIAGILMWPKILRQMRIARSRPDGIEVSSKKVTWDRRTATEADAKKRGRDFRRRQWLEGYKANGDHTAASDADAKYLIEEWIDLNFVEGKTNGAEIAQLCDKLAGPTGCDDPLVLTVTALNSIELYEKNRRLDRALAAFAQSRHKAYPKLNAAATLLESLDQTNSTRLREVYNYA